MRKESSTPTGELAQWLGQLCPGREADFVVALRWLYDHPREAAFLCGLGESAPRRELLLSIRAGDCPEYLALAAGAWWGKRENRKGENKRKTGENKRMREVAKCK